MYYHIQIRRNDVAHTIHNKVKLYLGGFRGSSPLQLYALHNEGLDRYRYNNSKWIQERSMLNIHARQLYFDVLGNRLIAETRQGISFYEPINNELSLLFKTEQFPENMFSDLHNGWNEANRYVGFGRFYHDSELLGILTYRRALGINLYVLMPDVILDNNQYPLFTLDTDFSIFGKCSQAKIALADLKQIGQENIIVHCNNGLNVYRLNQDNDVEHVLEVADTAKPDDSEEALFFPNLTGQLLRDIVLLNSTGLFVYQYRNDKSNYELIDYQSLFSKLKGWRQEYTDSIQFEDINLDGRQDMLFTGPHGINLLSFNIYTNQWKSLMENSQLTISERHSGVLIVLPASPPHTQYPIVFMEHKNQLQSANIVRGTFEIAGEFETHAIQNSSSNDVLSSPISPQIAKLNLKDEKSTRLLRDQLNYTSIIGALDRNTGKPKFQLKLIDLSNGLSNLKLDFIYDSSNQESDGLGVGWSLPKNFIIMDHQKSVFPEDEIYYIMLQDLPQILTFDPRNSTNDVYSFNLSSGQSDVQILYYKDKERWELDIKGVKQIYGRAQDDGSDSIGFELKWKNWRGKGSSSTGQEHFANIWYLSEVKDKYANVLRCTYDSVNVSKPGGKNFTTTISLKTISDNQGNKIILNYSDMDISDSKDSGNQNSYPNTQVRYVSGYTVTTPTYQQVINFIYEVKNRKLLLTKILQTDDITNKPILQFSYSEMSESNILNSVVLPTGARVRYDFELLGDISSIHDDNGQRYNVGNNHRVDYGDHYVLVSYINRNWQVVLRMFNKEMTEELYSSLSIEDSLRLPLCGRGVTKNYSVIFREGLAVILLNDTDNELYLLRQSDGKWLSKSYTFSKQAIIKPSTDFLVVEDSVIEVISWNKDSKEWMKDKPFDKLAKDKKHYLLSVFGRGLIIYYDNILSIRYKDRADQWKYKTIASIPGLINDITETLDKFDLDSERKNTLLDIFKNNALQISGNLLLLNRWKTDGMKLYSIIDLYVLDSNYMLAEHNQYEILQDDLNEFSDWLEYGTGSFFKFVYEIKNDGKFKVIAKDLRGVVLDEIHSQTDNRNRRNDRKEEILQEVTKFLEDNFKKPFLLNPQKYQALLNAHVCIINNTKFTYTGDKWEKNFVSEAELKGDAQLSIPIGDAFVLHKEDLRSSLKLYKQSKKELLLDLEIKQLNQTLIRYPLYMAYQQMFKPVNVVYFSKDSRIRRTYALPVNEKLSSFSSYDTLVTIVDSCNGHCKTLVLRPRHSVRLSLNNPVAVKVTVTLNDGSKRITGYEYSEVKAFGNTIYYGNISVIPGNDKSSFGWLEEFKDFTNRPEKRIFNAKGVLIKTLTFEGEQATADEENANLNTILFDKTGSLVVAKCLPNEIANEEIGYYGFEGYELNRIGENSHKSERKWIFNEEDVVKDGFSFTGTNYLRISGKAMEGSFKPSNQHQLYLASCWMRPKSQMLELGALVPYLKAVVTAKNIPETYIPIGVVKFKLDNWFYLEVIIDLIYAKESFESLNKSQTQVEQQNHIDLKISVVIAPGTNTTIDIDHVRFSPLRTNFKANVYDSKTRQVKEVIRANGMIERYIYDKYQKRVAVVSEYGEIREFSTYTKASSIGRITELKSKVVISADLGFVEDFSPYSFQERWIIDRTDAWRNSPGQLQHLTDNSNTLQLRSNYLNHTSYGWRFNFSLQSDGAVFNFNNKVKAIRTGNRAAIVFAGRSQSIPLACELVIVAEGRRVLVWIDGGLYFDSFTTISLFNLEIRGSVKISDLIVFSRPSVEVTYFNELDEQLQKIVLENENIAIVTQYLYDELGRQSITTQPVRIVRSNGLMAYDSDFVTNGNPYAAHSVFKTGKLQGNVQRTVGEYAYSQIQHCDNPTDEVCAVGLPGKEFSISGQYAKRYSSLTDNLFIKNLFPPSQSYSYRVEHKTDNVQDISVFDRKGNKVASYIRVPGRKDLLSTYEYNENGKLVKSLPPLYHEKAGTFYRQNNSTPTERKRLHDSFSVNISYDKAGNIITKTSPDSGKIENVYDKDGFLRFILYYSKSNIENILYFDYDDLGRLRSSREIISSASKEEILTLELSGNNTRVYQEFYYSDVDRHPLLRGNVARTITYNGEEPLIEEFVRNTDEEGVSKRIIIPSKDDEKPVLIALHKEYVAGKLKNVDYPIDIKGEIFRLTYQYDKLGKITGVGIPIKENLFASFTYNSDGQVSSEVHSPDSVRNFTRQYGYNTAGFLTSMNDSFLAEKIYYTEVGYGGNGYGDGTITRTEFKASWHENCDNTWLGLDERSFINSDTNPEQSATCFHKLMEAGYINKRGYQVKAYYSSLEHELPIFCGYGAIGRHIKNTLGEKGFPTEYGHSYDYGNYQELTKAKYFVGNEVPVPLQPDSFAKEISGINKTQSRNIFERLKNSEYMIQDNDKYDEALAHGKKGKSFIRPTLSSDLKNVNADYERYLLPLERLLIKCFSEKQKFSSIKWNLQKAFKNWLINTKEAQRTGNEILKMLEARGYLKNPLAKGFSDSLKEYQPFIHDIVRVLSVHFAKSLGEGEFDVEAYSIDANGNHKYFYTGFDRFKISYNHNNQVSSVAFQSFASSKEEQHFIVNHDSRGNVIQALHKGIEEIVYHPLSNRATKIKLIDGKVLTFYYDAQGERILKRVSDSSGQTIKEIHYIRDEFGQVLAERQISYIGAPQPDISVTAYIYGPRGLLGFIRGNIFYSVITDHEGSIRLVVKGDEVVAAYDYLPYGNLMRKYGNDPEAQISYRYTGQEWDEELGLYNYHARFYDPSIGRFYQIDPKEQYFSPYKYAGNSPVSMIDPNGELAFLVLLPVILVTVPVGLYLGGAAMNNRWNINEWDFESKETWFGMVGGGIAGAFLPVGFVGSAAAIGYTATLALGAGFTYLGMAAANNEWDPKLWKLDSPGTYYGAFQGFAAGSSIAGGVAGYRSMFIKLSYVKKIAFVVGTGTVGVGSFVVTGYQNHWDGTKPGLWFGLLQVVDDATNFPVFLNSVAKSARKSFLDIYRGIRAHRGHYSNFGVTHLRYSFRNAVPSTVFITFRVFGVSLPAFALTASNDGANMSNPNTYFDLIRNMAMIHQHWRMGKSLYIKRKLNKKLKISEKQKNVFSKIAMDTIELFTSHKNQLSGQGDNTFGTRPETSHDGKVGTPPKKWNIDNKAIAVTSNENFITAAFSGNKGDGFLAIFNKNDYSLISSEHIENNQIVPDDSYLELHNEISNEVDYFQEKTKKENSNQVRDTISELSEYMAQSESAENKQYLSKVLGEEYDKNINLFTDIFEYIHHELDKGVLINTDKLQHKISENFKTEAVTKLRDEITKLRGELTAKNKLKNNKKTTGKNGKKNKGTEGNVDNTLTDLETKINELKTSLKEGETELRRLAKEFMEKLEFLSEIKWYNSRLTHWDYTNCAEQHTIMNMLKLEMLPNAQNDITAMATYKLDPVKGSIEMFPRCDKCVTSTKTVANVISDPEWNIMLKINLNRYHKKMNMWNIPHILFPVTNSSFEKIHSNSNRKKRSEFVATSKVDVTSPTGAGKMKLISSKKTTSSAIRPPSIVNHLFGWVIKRVERVKGFVGSWLTDENTDFKPENSKTILGYPGMSAIDANGTILLLDTLIRRATGHKPIFSNVSSITEPEAHGYACNITEGFEEILAQASENTKISTIRWNIDFPQVQGEVMKKILSGKYDEILGVLGSHLLKASHCSKVGYHELSADKYNNLMTIIDRVLGKLLNELLSRILTGKNNTVKINEQYQKLENNRDLSFF